MSDIVEELTGEQPEPEAVPAEPVEQPKEEPQAEAAQEEEAPAEAEVPAEEPKEEPQNIPYSVFKSMRDDLKEQIAAAQAQARATEPKPEPVKVPDMFEDPEGFQRHMQQQMANARASTLADVSEAMAIETYGQEAVDAAFAAVKASGQGALFAESRNPYGDMVKWHKQQQVLQEIGDDPAAYRQKVETEVRQQIEAEIAAKQAKAMAEQAPPSMAKVNGAGGSAQPAWQGPTPLGDILG